MSGQYYSSTDQQKIFCHQWLVAKPSAIVLIAHGGAEHGGRYAATAKELNHANFSVWAPDHRGHGKSLIPACQLGSMGAENVWRHVVDDMVMLAGEIVKQNPETPIFLLGHSLGSLVAQMLLVDHSSLFAGAILSGAPSLETFASLKPILKMLIDANGRDDIDENLQTELLAGFNQSIENPRTEADWISTDPDEVDKYLQDSLCGFAYPNGVWLDIVTASKITSDAQALAQISNDFPIYIFSGERDPVHLEQTGLATLNKQYHGAGLVDVSTVLYDNARHEMFNEVQRLQVVSDLVAWLNAKISS